jgi:polar amino acid transport system substrate-binding protein
MAEVDRTGVRIMVPAKAAYDLYLTRTIKNATLSREPGADAAFKKFVDDKMDVLAGLKPRIKTDHDNLPGSRLLEGRFTAVQQAVGTPKGHDTGAQYLRAYVEDIKASGLVARTIEKNGISGVSVAP